MSSTFNNCKVCVDCILYIANGDLPDNDEQFLKRAQVYADTVIWYVGWADQKEISVPDYGALEFSITPCDCCGSTLAGQRYKACYKELM